MNGSEAFYGQVIKDLNKSGIPYLVGGSYALFHYAKPKRRSKDLDIMCLPTDVSRIFKYFSSEGLQTEMTDKKWLGKIFNPLDYVDVIFSTSNDKIKVKKACFNRGQVSKLFGHRVKFLSPEDVVINKIYVFARDCFHGHDIYKLIHVLGDKLDWKIIWRAVRSDWRILHAHIVLFDFVFPHDSAKVPQWLRKEVFQKVEANPKQRGRFNGNVLSMVDYPRKRKLKVYAHPLKK